MYAMSRFDPALFPPPEAEIFVSRLFAPRPGLPGIGAADGEIIRDHIITLYRRFMDESPPPGAPWEDPLLRFLQGLPTRDDNSQVGKNFNHKGAQRLTKGGRIRNEE
jgi:hypothetical protein